MLQLTRREQLGAIILVVLLLLGLLIRNLLLPKPAVEVITPPETPAEAEQTEQEIVVCGRCSPCPSLHAAGRLQGLYGTGSGRGVLPEADQHALNLAEPLLDGRRITVPFQGSKRKMRLKTANKY